MAMPKRVFFPEMTAEYLRSIVGCNPVTGQMWWLEQRGANARKGEIVGSYRKKDGYFQVKVDRKMYLVHRLIWLWVNGSWPTGFLDHKNRNRSDNRIDNLRDCTLSQNGANRPAQSNNKLGCKGVHKVVWPGGSIKYKAQVYISENGKKRMLYLGCYDTVEEASEVYKEKSLELFGEFHRTEA